jgi:hypothetical protein
MSVSYIYAALVVRTEFDLRVSEEGTTCTSMRCAHNAGKCSNVKLANISFENMANFKYLGRIQKKLNILCKKKVRGSYI